MSCTCPVWIQVLEIDSFQQTYNLIIEYPDPEALKPTEIIRDCFPDNVSFQVYLTTPSSTTFPQPIVQHRLGIKAKISLLFIANQQSVAHVSTAQGLEFCN